MLPLTGNAKTTPLLQKNGDLQPRTINIALISRRNCRVKSGCCECGSTSKLAGNYRSARAIRPRGGGGKGGGTGGGTDGGRHGLTIGDAVKVLAPIRTCAKDSVTSSSSGSTPSAIDDSGLLISGGGGGAAVLTGRGGGGGAGKAGAAELD